MDTIIKGAGVLVMAVALVCVIGMLFAWPLMMLWNSCLVPALPGIREIGWVQAWGIMIVCGLLFKNSVSTKA